MINGLFNERRKYPKKTKGGDEMVIRLAVIFVLLFTVTGCMKKTADENASVEPAATEESTAATAVNNTQEAGAQEQAANGKSVSVEPAVSQAAAAERPSGQDIQQALKNAKFYEGKVDGIIGPKTRKAIEAFQSHNGLRADGRVGPKTWQKLKEYLVKKAK